MALSCRVPSATGPHVGPDSGKPEAGARTTGGARVALKSQASANGISDYSGDQFRTFSTSVFPPKRQ